MITDDELDVLGFDEVKNRLDRGDWIDQVEIIAVNSWLKKAKNQQDFLQKCKRASMSSALDTKRLAIFANVIAALALVVSIIALVK